MKYLGHFLITEVDIALSSQFCLKMQRPMRMWHWYEQNGRSNTVIRKSKLKGYKKGKQKFLITFNCIRVGRLVIGRGENVRG